MKTNYKKTFLSLIFGLCLVFTLFSISYLGVKVNAVESENPETEETTPEVTEKKYIQEDNGFYGELIIRSNGTYYIMCHEKGTGGSTETGEGTYTIKEGYYELNLNSSIMEVTVNDELGTWSDYTPPVVPEVVVPSGTFTFEDENGVATLTFIDAKKLHMKVVTLDGEVLENDLEYIYNEEKNYYEVGTGTETEQKFTIDLENHTFVEYIEEETLEETAKEIGIEVERFVMIIAGILSALGVSGATIATFFKWINKKLKKNNEDLKDSKVILKEAKEMFEKSIENNEEANKFFKNATEIMEKTAELIKTIYDESKEKSEEIGKLASEVLTENTEGGGENDSI